MREDDGDSIERLVCLLQAAGEALDRPPKSGERDQREALSSYLHEMQTVAEERKLPYRMRHLIKTVLELRAAGYVRSCSCLL